MGTATVRDITSVVRLAKSGNREALSMLIEQTQNKFHRFLCGLTGNKALADDLCQESYIKTLENLDKLKDDSKFLSWLYRTGKNIFLDHLKSKHNKTEPVTDDATVELDRSSILSMEDVIDINKALQLLGIEERMVLITVDMEGYSYSEAAELLELSEDSIRMRLFRARQKFVSNFETTEPLKSSIKWEKKNEL